MNKPKHDSVQIQIKDKETAEKNFKRAAARVQNDPGLRHAMAQIAEAKDEDDKKRLGLDRAEAQQIISDIVGDGEDQKAEADAELGPTEAARTDPVARAPLNTSPRIGGVKPPPAPAVPAESPEPPATESAADAEAMSEADAAVGDTRKQRRVLETVGILAAVTTVVVLAILVTKSVTDDETVSEKTAPQLRATSTEASKTQPAPTAGDCASLACGDAKTAEPKTSAEPQVSVSAPPTASAKAPRNTGSSRPKDGTKPNDFGHGVWGKQQ